MALPVLTVPAFLQSSLEAGHPWIYRNQVPRGTRLPDGTWVSVQAGGYSVVGLWDASSPIAVRVYSRERAPDLAFWRSRFEQSFRLREPLREQGVTAFRWVSGEGDRLPGLVVDYYAGFAVLVTYTKALEPHLSTISEALSSVTPLRGLLLRRRGSDEPIQTKVEVLRGRPNTSPLVVEEYGVRLKVDLFSGQKTGLFIDHRENRRTLGQWCKGREVLNLFAYTGAFSLHAAVNGAARVVSVDSAAPAIEAARENFVLNGLASASHEFQAQDVFEYLERARAQARRFDVVICDPPSFAHRREQLKVGLRAYRKLNTSALRAVRDEGLFASASCTAQVSPEAFRTMLSEAAFRAKRRLQIIHEAGQALDHPVMAQHPEGRYLKFVVGRVLPRE